MAARAPPAVPVSSIRVVNSGTCIGFLDAFRAHCKKHGFPWYPIFALPHNVPEAELVIARARAERARQLGARLDAELDAYLAGEYQSETLPPPVRLNMAAGDAETPAPTQTTTSPPTRTIQGKAPSIVLSTYTFGQIDDMTYAAVFEVTNASFVQGPAGPLAGKDALQKLVRIYAPTTPAAEFTAAQHYNDQLRPGVLTTSTSLPEFWDQLRQLARIWNYHSPNKVPTTRLIQDAVRAMIVTF